MNKLHLLLFTLLFPKLVASSFLDITIDILAKNNPKARNRNGYDNFKLVENAMPDNIKKNNITPLMLVVTANELKHTIAFLPYSNVNQQNIHGVTALHLAANNNNKKIFQALLGVPNIDVNQKTMNGNTVIMLIAEQGYYELGVMLIKKCRIRMRKNQHLDGKKKHSMNNQGQKVDVKEIQSSPDKVLLLNITNTKGEAAIHLAFPAEKPNYKMIRLLLSCYDLDPNIEETMCGYGPLIKAILHGYNQLAIDFLKHPNIRINQPHGYFWETALMYSSKLANLKVMKKIMQHRDKNGKRDIAINQVSREGNGAIHYAVISGEEEGLSLLLKEKNINTLLKNNDGETAFDVAKEKKEEAAQLVKQKKKKAINLDKQKKYQAICDMLKDAYYKRVFDFFEAIYQDDIKTIEELSQSPDLDPNAINPYNGATLVMLASYLQDAKVLEVLLKVYGANPNIADLKYRSTPLMVASGRGYHLIVEILLKYNANVNKQDINLYTALWLACYGGYVRVVRLLLGCHDIDIYLANIDRISPIAITCEKGHNTICKKLLKKSDAIYLNESTQGYAALIAASYYQHDNNSTIVKKLLKCDKIDWYGKGRKYCLDALLIAKKNHRDRVVAVFYNHFSQNKNRGYPAFASSNRALALLDQTIYDLNKAILTSQICYYAKK